MTEGPGIRVALIVALVSGSLPSCAITRPCTEGGDVSWGNQEEIKGDKICFKKLMPDGRLVNHGKYQQLYPNGKVAIEGQFLGGKRDGVWAQYNEAGEKIMERFYNNGVERPFVMAAPGSGSGSNNDPTPKGPPASDPVPLK